MGTGVGPDLPPEGARLRVGTGVAAGFWGVKILFTAVKACLAESTSPPRKNPGRPSFSVGPNFPPLILSRKSTPTFLTADALITYSPFDNRAGIESLMSVPGPRTFPPSSICRGGPERDLLAIPPIDMRFGIIMPPRALVIAPSAVPSGTPTVLFLRGSFLSLSCFSASFKELNPEAIADPVLAKKLPVACAAVTIPLPMLLNTSLFCFASLVWAAGLGGAGGTYPGGVGDAKCTGCGDWVWFVGVVCVLVVVVCVLVVVGVGCRCDTVALLAAIESLNAFFSAVLS